MGAYTPIASLISLLLFCYSLIHVAADAVPHPKADPDYSKDPFPPYPPLTADGSGVGTSNLRPTHLFGWTNCGRNENKIIQEAYNDFYTLAQQKSLYNIDWNDQAAREFFGPSVGPNKIPDNRRGQIQQIFHAAQQIYSNPYHVIPPPFDKGPQLDSLWIKVRCSGGDGSGDPGNVCKDKKPDPEPGQCAPNKDGSPGGKSKEEGGTLMEAYSSPLETYSTITFCNRFFNNLGSLTEVTNRATKQPLSYQNNLWNWNGRARCFFHEITHLNYFMNAPDKSPYVNDLIITIEKDGKKEEHDAYGPKYTKMLRNWVAKGKSGFYTQQNADNYAYFAMAKYVQDKIGRYPSDPKVGSKKPERAPQFPKDDDDEPTGTGTADQLVPGTEDLLGPTDIDSQPPPGATIPGCPGVHSVAEKADTSPQCDNTHTTEVPFNVFAGNVYSGFCDAVEKDKKTKLTWNVDAQGKQKKMRKRTPPPNPSKYGAFTFELDWEPGKTTDQCSRGCKAAFDAFAGSTCGRQGGQSNSMAGSGSVDVGCGTYKYKISPSATPPPKPALSTRTCLPDKSIGQHDDIQEYQVTLLAAAACMEKKTIKKGDSSTFIKRSQKVGGVLYNFNVSWKDGCESNQPDVDVNKPLSDNDATCRTLLFDNYKQCINGGIGGSITAGCVVYEFRIVKSFT